MNKTLVHITTVPVSLRFFTGQIGFMKTHDFDVHVVSSPGDQLREFGEREQVATHGVVMTRRITPLRDAVAMFQLQRLLRRIRPAIVHAHTPKGGLLGVIGAWLAGVPVRIYHIHGLPFLGATGLKRRLLWWSERVACHFAHRVLCVSHSIRAIAVEEGLCPSDRITVLVNGTVNGVDAHGEFDPRRIGPARRHEIRTGLGIPDDALVVGFVGRVVRDKGVVELAAAWSTLREEFPSLHLLVVGPFEPQDPVPSSVEQSLRSDGRVHLTGWVEQAAPYYGIMDVLALPTYREGFGLAAIEASAMEVPVVATNIPGCVEAVADGVSGTVVPARDAPGLTSALREYLRDPELRRRVGSRGRERVLQSFAPQPIWEALHEEYGCLLGFVSPR